MSHRFCRSEHHAREFNPAVLPGPSVTSLKSVSHLKPGSQRSREMPGRVSKDSFHLGIMFAHMVGVSSVKGEFEQLR